MSLDTVASIGLETTTPSDPSKRIPDELILIVPCEVSDAEMIAKCIYTCFPPSFWDRMEPPSLRPSQSTRTHLMAKRITPSLLEPDIKWIKAIHAETNACMGIASWTAPGAPIHNFMRRSAIQEFKWQTKMSWTDADIDEMWAHVSDTEWNVDVARNDDIREELFGDTPHWYLSPVCTWPEYQGKGVGKKLLNWAIKQADATEPVTPLYLESAPSARKVYEHVGFEAYGPKAFVRRGPKVAKGEKGD